MLAQVGTDMDRHASTHQASGMHCSLTPKGQRDSQTLPYPTLRVSFLQQGGRWRWTWIATSSRTWPPARSTR